MLKTLSEFITTHNLENQTLLLGLSGGPDSRALFHLLLRLKHPFEVAHFDHGWRDKSMQESLELSRLCQNRSVVFHSHRSEPIEKGNLEDRARQMRYSFFQQVCEQRGLAGVLLGHHADDQAETVLKRVFEGASLPKLRGLAPKKERNGLILYRPFLNLRKKEILQWLKIEKIPYFEDPTNADPHYLRSRMRLELLPTLSKQFGKQIESSLCRLGNSAGELAQFLEHTLAPFLKQVVENEKNISIDFTKWPPQDPFIYKAVIRELFERQRITISNSILATILVHIQKNSAHKRIRVGKNEVEIDRGILRINKLKLLSL